MAFEDFLDSVKSGLEKVGDKVGDKVEEIKDSKETQEFITKAKDVVIDVGVRVADVAEEVSDRAKEAMHKAAEKNQKDKAAKETAKGNTSQTVEVVQGEVVDDTSTGEQ